MRTTDLIAVVSQDRHVAATPDTALWTAAAMGLVLTAGMFFAAVGPRPDFDAAIGTVRFPFKFVVTGLLAATSLGLLARTARPDRDGGRWRGALTAVLVLVGLAVVAELMAIPARQWETRLVGTNARLCLTLVPLLSIAPLTCLMVALRWAAPARPAVAGAMAGLAASSMAAFFYAANCIDDSPLFVMAWYTLAIGAVTAVGLLVGRRMLRW